jgi:adenylate cyclase
MQATADRITGAAQALRRADVDSERLAALIRVAIFAAILAAVTVAQSAGFDHRPLVLATYAYGAGTVVALTLAWRRIFHPALPFVFVAMDVTTLAFTIHLLGRALDMRTGLAVTLPVGGLVILVLLHASMHQRPALVLFGASAFVACLVGGALAPTLPVPVARLPGDAGEHLGHFRLFPVAIFFLASAILVVTTRRTRRFVEEAFAHASRAATLSRYFSPEVVDELTRRAPGAESFGERMAVAVLFADIRGFTAMAEAMDPAELAGFLSEFRTRIAAPAIAHGGVVDKYIGDGIMVVFGAPRPHRDDARRALLCATAMADAIGQWSEERQRQRKARVAVGIGAHYGQAFAGVLSDGRQLEYTVIGDTVNVASRLADLATHERTQVHASSDLVDAAGPLPDAAAWTRMPAQALPGHPRLLTVHRRG